MTPNKEINLYNLLIPNANHLMADVWNGTTGGGLSWKQLHDSSMEADSMETQVQKFTQVGVGNMKN